MQRPTEPALSVRTTPWLPVFIDGRPVTLALDEVLERAHEISDLNISNPLERSGALRFLVSITALIGRELSITTSTARGVADRIPADVIKRVLDDVDEFLWLIHPETPFMQEGRYRTEVPKFLATPTRNDKGKISLPSDPIKPAASIAIHVPGGSSKAWYNVIGDAFEASTLTHERAALTLISVWFHAPGGNSAVGLFPAQKSIGTANNAFEHFWHEGENLAETLFMNLDPQLTYGSDKPAWAQTTLSIAGVKGELERSTMNGTSVLLVFEEESQLFTHAYLGGIVRTEFDTDIKIERDQAKKLSKQVMEDAQEADPRRIWHMVGKERKQFARFNPARAAMQNISDWYLLSERSKATPGVLKNRTGKFQVLLASTPVNTYASFENATWFGLDAHKYFLDIEDGDAVARIADFSTDSAKDAEYRIRSAVIAAFPKELKEPMGFRQQVVDEAVARYYGLAEQMLAANLADAAHGYTRPAYHAEALRQFTIEAFDAAVGPFTEIRNLPLISRGRNRLRFASHKKEA